LTFRTGFINPRGGEEASVVVEASLAGGTFQRELFLG
jgi:hypothetical protein